MKKLLALLLCAVLCLSLAACASNTATTTTGTTETTVEPAAEETASSDASAETAQPAADAQQYVVGICQLVQHDALDAATNGFMDALNEALPGQVTFDLKNASNDIPTCGTIVTGFVASNVDLILANATPALQAASTATQTIPILGTAVTEYGVALDIKDFNGTVGGNISGTSDLAPLDQQADMLLELLPEAQNVGILYCSAEANSVYQADVVKAALEEKGVNVTVYTFADSNDVATVTQTGLAPKMTRSTSRPITLPLPAPRQSTTSQSLPASPSSRAKRASARAAASQRFPSTTMSLAKPPVRWLRKF